MVRQTNHEKTATEENASTQCYPEMRGGAGRAGTHREAPGSVRQKALLCFPQEEMGEAGGMNAQSSLGLASLSNCSGL